MNSNLAASFSAVLNPIKENFGSLIAKIPLLGQVALVVFVLFLAVKFLEKRFPQGFSLKINLKALRWGLTCLLAFLLLINFAQIIVLNSRFQKEIARQKEAERPANLTLIEILPADCSSCQGALPLVEALKKQSVKIEKEDKLSPTDSAAQQLIKQYRIEKIPGLIVEGELEKENIAKFFSGRGQVENGVFVAQNLTPPYFDLKQNKVVGEITSLTYLKDSTCSECYDVSKNEQILANAYTVKPAKTQTFDITSSQGRALLARYKITLVPTFILEGDFSPYLSLQQVWPQVGTKEINGAYVFRQGVKLMGPYKDLSTGQVIKPTPQVTPTPTIQPLP